MDVELRLRPGQQNIPHYCQRLLIIGMAGVLGRHTHTRSSLMSLCAETKLHHFTSLERKALILMLEEEERAKKQLCSELKQT